MKKRLLILALCLGTGGISAANPLAAINDDPPPRMEKIGRERTIPLLRDGKTEMEIVIPADAFPIVRFAAEEIQKTLQKASGAEIPVLNAPSGSGRTVLFLGDQEAVRGAGIKVDSIPRDGFILKTAGRQIYLAGRDDPKLRPDAFGIDSFALCFDVNGTVILTCHLHQHGYRSGFQPTGQLNLHFLLCHNIFLLNMS